MMAVNVSAAAGKVLCVGVNPAFDETALVDGLDDERVNRVLRQTCEAAGKAANVACGLLGAGVASRLTGFFGEDNFPLWKQLFSQRSHGKVWVEAVLCQGSVRRNTTLLTEGRTIKINYPGCRVSAENIAALEQKIASQAREYAMAVFTGSLPPGMESADYLRLMSCAAGGCSVVLDTDRLTEKEILAARPHIYKPNAHELAAVGGLAPEDTEGLIAYAKKLASCGVDIVLLTLGGRGLAAVTARETARVTVPEVSAVNTVGAGDAALAAFIAASLQGASLEAAAQEAALAGTGRVICPF